MLVIFDCDGVLVDSEYLIASVEAEIFSGYGYEITPEEDIRLFSGKSQKSTIETVESVLGQKLPETIGPEIDNAVTAAMKERLKSIRDVSCVLEGINTKCVASSSTKPMILQSLTITGLKDYFEEDHIFSTSMVRHGKPAPDIFIHAASSMGFGPDDCIVVEDSIAGVRAATSAGIKVIGYIGGSHILSHKHGETLLANGAMNVFSDMKDIKNFLTDF